MKSCSKCGRLIRNDSTYCANCGISKPFSKQGEEDHPIVDAVLGGIVEGTLKGVIWALSPSEKEIKRLEEQKRQKEEQEKQNKERKNLNELVRILNRYKNQFENGSMVYFKPQIPEIILVNALKSYTRCLQDVQKEHVLLLISTTSSDGMEEGALLTGNTLYANSLTLSKHIPLCDIMEVSLIEDMVHINGQAYFYCHNDEENMINMLEDIVLLQSSDFVINDDDLYQVLANAKETELEIIAKVISKKWSSSIGENCHSSLKIASEIQLMGGNSIANKLRGHGVCYREIVIDVARIIKVKDIELIAAEKEINISTIEKKVFEKLIANIEGKMDESSRKILYENIRESASEYDHTLDIIQRVVLPNLLKTIGLETVAIFIASRAATAWIPVVGWMSAGIGAIAELGSAAYSVTVPCVVIIGLIRARLSGENSMPNNESSPPIQESVLNASEKPLSEKQVRKIKELEKAHEQGFLSNEDLKREIEKMIR